MWIIAWEDTYGERFWEVVGGEDAMRQRVDEIVKLGLSTLEVVVPLPPEVIYDLFGELAPQVSGE